MTKYLKPIPVISSLVVIAFFWTLYLVVLDGFQDELMFYLFILSTVVFLALVVPYLISAVIHNKWRFWR